MLTLLARSLQIALLALLRTVQDVSTTPVRRDNIFEFLSDLCRQPTFLEDIFANYDCNPGSQNIFEELMQAFATVSLEVRMPRVMN